MNETLTHAGELAGTLAHSGADITSLVFFAALYMSAIALIMGIIAVCRT